MNMNIMRPAFGTEEIQLIQQCLDSGWVTQGPMVQEFERLFAERHKVRYALATTSCTAALHLATMALELAPGDEVIVPAFTWVTSAHCAEYVGATVRFADVEANTFNLDPAAFEAAITQRTKAVVVVHLFGLAAKMDEIMAIAARHGIRVIEDAACAIGTTYDGRLVGGFGDLGCFSFHPRKVITTGEGGMVSTNNDYLANRVRCLRNHGATGVAPTEDPTMPYTMGTFNMLGYNLRLSDIQAAVGVAQMAKMNQLMEERKQCAMRYNALLADIDEIARPEIPQKCGHTYQSYVIRIVKGGRERRNRIMEYLQCQGIQTRPGTHAVHRLGYYREKYGLKPEQFPIAAASEDTTITLPIFPGMSDTDSRFVADSLRAQLA